MFIWDIDSSPEFMQWCSEWAIFLNLHTAAEHRVQEGLTKIHYITPILQKEHETLCFSCGRFSSKNRETSQGTSETAPPAGSAWKLSTARQPDICCGSYLDYEEWFENMAGVFFLPQDAMEKVDVHTLTSIDTLKMILARTSKDGSIPSFHPVRRRVWCLAKRRITSFFRLKVLVRFLSGAPTVFWEDGGKGYSDGKASEKM